MIVIFSKSCVQAQEGSVCVCVLFVCVCVGGGGGGGVNCMSQGL